MKGRLALWVCRREDAMLDLSEDFMASTETLTNHLSSGSACTKE